MSLDYPPKEAVQEWIDALRSGEYKQSRNRLQDANGYCCMGVACELFIPKEKQWRHANDQSAGLLKGHTPGGEQSEAPEWLKNIDLITAKLSKGTSLVMLNDGYWHSTDAVHLSLTFDEIADVLQLLYIEGALDEA